MNGCSSPLKTFFVLTLAGAASLGALNTSRADLIAGDSFVVGDGGYAPGNLTDQPVNGTAPASTGFLGVFGKTPTSYLQPDAAGLKSSAAGYKGGTGGSIRLNSTPNVDGESRSLTRVIKNSEKNPSILYFSGLLQTEKALSQARGGFFEFGNRNQPVTAGEFLGSSPSHRGFEIGIQGNSFVVITAHSGLRMSYASTYIPLVGKDAASTNLFIARLAIDPGGNDSLVVYLNPKDVSSEEKARQTSTVTLEFDNRDIASHPSEISNAGFRTISTASDQTPIFADELRIGSTFESVVAAVP